MIIVLETGTLLDYPQGGGQWSWHLQFFLLGQEVFLLEVPRIPDQQSMSVA
jgi:hypothetical protein